MTGDPAIARKALLTHPLIGQHPLSEDLVDRLLEAGSEHLPQFHAETRAMSRAAVLAVDGGNSKTDLALVDADGSVLALVRGPLSSPHHLGIDGAWRFSKACWRRRCAKRGSAITPAALRRSPRC